jgi:uncharacterized membrane protein (UPF0127 family)
MLLGLLMIGVALASPEEESTAAVGVTTRSVLSVPPQTAGTVAPTTPAGFGGLAPPRSGRQALRGFGEVQVTIIAENGKRCDVCLLSAISEVQRERGLMEVSDTELGGYDGMLFEYPREVQSAFWMRNTPMPLSIAYFDETGSMVSRTDMTPCEDSARCPSYPPGATFKFALEMPQGRFPSVGIRRTARIVINSRTCKAAKGGR